MSDSDDTIKTAYGRLDRAALREVQDTYDTTALLRMVDELDGLLASARAEDGLRDMLLRLHGMGHTVINGAGMTVTADEESLPELVFDVMAEIQRMITILRGWKSGIEPLERLTPRD